jgi:7-carboxy-7-deazaguanine synthase (Cx14CxxC type)
VEYKIKEIFYTLQGEGTHAGRPAVFCRFSSCNLWTGREEDRARAICQFCDTDFVGTDGPGGGRFATADDLAAAVAAKWPEHSREHRMVVCTGGEPTLQLDGPAVDALHREGFYISVETNGTRPVPDGVDWVCVSPKAGADLVLLQADEVKLVHPQVGADPALFEQVSAGSYRLQPMDGPELAANTATCVEYCLTHPKWGLSLQTHKYLGIP